MLTYAHVCSQDVADVMRCFTAIILIICFTAILLHIRVVKFDERQKIETALTFEGVLTYADVR